MVYKCQIDQCDWIAFSSSMSTDIFGLNILSICLKRMLKFPTMIIDLSILLFYSIVFFFKFSCYIIRCIHFYNRYIFCMNCPFYLYEISIFISGNFLFLEICFIYIEICILVLPVLLLSYLYVVLVTCTMSMHIENCTSVKTFVFNSHMHFKELKRKTVFFYIYLVIYHFVLRSWRSMLLSGVFPSQCGKLPIKQFLLNVSPSVPLSENGSDSDSV